MMDRIGKQLGDSQQIGATLQHVAEMFVPQFADHCFIDLFQGDVLIRRVQRHTGDWTPPPGTGAQVGEQIRFPVGHFCQQAMARLDTVLWPGVSSCLRTRVAYPDGSGSSFLTPHVCLDPTQVPHAPP